MLTYSPNKEIIFKQEDVDQLLQKDINQLLTDEAQDVYKQFNETQRTLLIEVVIVSSIENVLATFKHYPGNAVNFLQDLFKVNNMYLEALTVDASLKQQKRDEADNNRQSLLKQYRKITYKQPLPPKAISDLITKNSKFLAVCCSNLEEINIHDRLQNSRITPQQRKAAHAVVRDLLKSAISFVEQTDAYKLAQKNNRLYYTPALLNPTMPEYYLPYIPSHDDLVKANQRNISEQPQIKKQLSK